MEADWNETIGITVPGPNPNGPPSKLTAFAFDPLQELLWIGDENVGALSPEGESLSACIQSRLTEVYFPGPDCVLLWTGTAELHFISGPCKHRAKRT